MYLYALSSRLPGRRRWIFRPPPSRGRPSARAWRPHSTRAGYAPTRPVSSSHRGAPAVLLSTARGARRGTCRCRRPSCAAVPGVATAAEKLERCARPWCFVDPKQCARPHHAAIGRLLGGEAQVSYATCGYRSPLNGQFLAASLREGRALRVGMPGDSGTGYTLVTEEDGNRGGSYVTFMQRVFEAHGVQYNLVPISAGSMAVGKGSSWKGCVEDVAIGALDLCIGNFGPSAWARMSAARGSAAARARSLGAEAPHTRARARTRQESHTHARQESHACPDTQTHMHARTHTHSVHQRPAAGPRQCGVPRRDLHDGSLDVWYDTHPRRRLGSHHVLAHTRVCRLGPGGAAAGGGGVVEPCGGGG